MFAYTGLKPEQMDALAKEVSREPDPGQIILKLIGLALRLRHQGRPYLRCWYHFRQRPSPGRVHLQGDWLNYFDHELKSDELNEVKSRRWSWLDQSHCTDIPLIC